MTSTVLDWLEGAKAARTKLEDTVGLVQVLIEMGMLMHRKGEYAQAQEPLNKGLALAQELGDKRGIAGSFNNLENMALSQGDYAAAWAYYEESLTLYREMGNKWGIAIALICLGGGISTG